MNTDRLFLKHKILNTSNAHKLSITQKNSETGWPAPLTEMYLHCGEFDHFLLPFECDILFRRLLTNDQLFVIFMTWKLKSPLWQCFLRNDAFLLVNKKTMPYSLEHEFWYLKWIWASELFYITLHISDNISVKMIFIWFDRIF